MLCSLDLFSSLGMEHQWDWTQESLLKPAMSPRLWTPHNWFLMGSIMTLSLLCIMGA